MGKKYIIGGGISGLVYALLNPDYELIAPPFETENNFSRNYMIWLHDCAEMRYFLHEAGIRDLEAKQKRSYIGYFHKGRIHDVMTEEIKADILTNKLFEWDEMPFSDVEDSGKGSKFSLTQTEDENNFMNTLDVDLGSLMFTLRKAAASRHSPATVLEINDEYIRISNTNDYNESICLEYDRLISTIPAPIFYKLYTHSVATPKFESLPTTNIVVRRRPQYFDDKYELIYYGAPFEYSRISHLHNKYCYEFTGKFPKALFEAEFPQAAGGLFDYWVQPVGRILSQPVVSPSPKIVFAGRFSKWDYSVTTEHVIKQALEEK